MKTPLPLYAPLPTPEEMRRWDEAAHSRFGIPTLLLMENAAQAAFSVLNERCPLKPESRILIFMGRGNNGGDGAALARLLHDEGHGVLVLASGPVDGLGSPGREHALMAQTLGVNFLSSNSGTAPELSLGWDRPDVVIDAITGTGIRGELRDRELGLVHAINAFRENAFILALDIPSGLCGYTGRPKPEAVRAHATVTFEAGKPGLYFPEAREFTGSVIVRRVGLPMALRASIPPSWLLLAPQKGTWALPSPWQHKGGAGKTLVIGGCEGMAGAPLLAALGSLRAGAGLAHAALPGGLEAAVRSACPDILSHPVGSGQSWRENDAPGLVSLIRNIAPDALVIGPGMGRTAATRAIVQAVLAEKNRPPVVLDADALFFFHLPDHRTPPTGPAAGQAAGSATGPEPLPLSWELLTENDVLTPHPGEMARMLPCSFFSEAGGKDGEAPPPLRACIATLQEDRAGALRALTRVCKAVAVLKGAGTLIGRRGSPTVLSPFTVSTLGVGGSGDVLAGVCAALMASGIGSLDAACLAVYLHGRAGEMLAQKSPRGHLARDIADAVSLAWKDLC